MTDITPIVVAVIGLCSLIFTVVLIPYLKKKGKLDDLHQHCEVEDELFVPAVQLLEAKVAVEGGKAEKETTSAAQQEMLSEREREIVGCIVRGMTNKEIAENLFISVNTVLTHRKNISRKLNIHSVSGLTIYAIVNKLVNVGDIHLQ